MTTTHYLEERLPPEIIEKLEAGAFRSVCSHLRERSDAVQNIDMMTVTGFCRNCLAKWLVVEARKLEGADAQVQQALDALGYSEAAEYVYGCEYGEWKKRHATKATDDQMQRFNESKPLWAKHSKELLQTRGEMPSSAIEKSATATPDTSTAPAASSLLLSNVCCQDVEETKDAATKDSRKVTSIATPHVPEGGVEFRVGILTVSDRAATNQYETGDLSGPAVKSSLENTVRTMNASSTAHSVSMKIVKTAIIPDSMEEIQNTLVEWATNKSVDLILTTGGTGFASRDVTPEATQKVLHRECHGLMAYCLTECSLQQQPLASLSRGTAGVCDKTFIANLPGNPKGVTEIVPVLLPLVLYAIKDIQRE